MFMEAALQLVLAYIAIIIDSQILLEKKSKKLKWKTKV